MLPPGHIAAGFLVAKGVINYLEPSLNTEQINNLLILGAFFGFMPDLDMFWSFFKMGKFIQPPSKINHRSFFTHLPLFWLITGLLIYIFGSNDYWKTFGIILWLSTWSHFFLDSIQYGIRWLWPISKKYYAFADKNITYKSSHSTFFRFWFEFLKFYIFKLTPTFVLEVVILLYTLHFFI